MKSRIGRETATLVLPVLLLAGLGLLMRPKPAPLSPLKVLTVTRWVPNSAGVNYFNINMILEWNRPWFDKRASFPFQSQGQVMDADGKVVATQRGYAFGHEGKIGNRYYYVFTLNEKRPSSTSWKEPLTFQSRLQIDDALPLEVNLQLPAVNRTETPRPSKLPFVM